MDRFINIILGVRQLETFRDYSLAQKDKKNYFRRERLEDQKNCQKIFVPDEFETSSCMSLGLEEPNERKILSEHTSLHQKLRHKQL